MGSWGPVNDRLLRNSLMVGGIAAAAYYVPSTLILPTFRTRPPRSLPSGWCRWSGPEEGNQIALTFDDGPSLETLPLLELLDELRMPATFFVLGRQIRTFPDIVRLMVERGHEVAIHGYDHRHHLLSTPRAVRRDLHASVEAYREILGSRPRFYRPTYGQCTASTLLETRRLDLELVLWSRWGKEFATTYRAEVLERLRPGLRPGAILLLHDVDVSCREGTAALTRAVLPPLQEMLVSRDLRSVTLGRLLGPRGSSGSFQRSSVGAPAAPSTYGIADDRRLESDDGVPGLAARVGVPFPDVDFRTFRHP